MKKITELAVEYLLQSNPAVRVEQRGFERVAVIPEYNVETDGITYQERLVVPNGTEVDG